jgi:TPR repeat protein
MSKSSTYKVISFPKAWPLNFLLRLSGCILICSLLLVSACSTTPKEKTSADKTSILEAQEKRFQIGKELYLDKQYGPAANILLPLARQGHLQAQYTVGYMFHHGQGLPRNAKESTRWITMAAARGHEKAKEALNRINAMHDQLNPLP